MIKKTSSNQPCGRDSEYIIAAFLKSFSILCACPFRDPICICGSTNSMRGSRGGREQGPLEKHKAIGFLSNAGPDPLQSQKADKAAFNVEPLSARL